MNSLLNSFACLTVFTFSVYIILRIVSKSFSAVFNRERKHTQRSSVSDVDTQDIRRDMGVFESYLTELNERYGTKIYAVLSLNSVVKLRRYDIKNTLLLLARKHPILRARTSYPITHAQRRQFIINSENKFVPELRFVNTSNWKMVLEEELIVSNERTYDQLFWKTIVLREQYEARQKVYINTLLFLFDPVIVDRISVVKFTQDFIAAVCQLVNCDICVGNSRTLHLLAPTEEYLRPPCLVLLVLMFKQVFMKLQSYIKGPVSKHKNNQRYRHRVKPLIVVKSLSEKDTSRLLKYCNNSNCSLTALFTAAWSDIMSGRTGSMKALCHKKPVTVVVDYRTLMMNELPQSYLSHSSSYFQLQLNDPQNKCRYFRSTVSNCENLLKSSIKKKKHLNLIWQLKYNSFSRECLDRSSPLEIADIGSYKFNQTCPFSLHEIFIGASSTSNVSLSLLIVNNKLCCGMHLSSHFSGCADLLNALFARIVQNMSLNI